MTTGRGRAPGVVMQPGAGWPPHVVAALKDTLEPIPSPRGGWGGNHSPPPINDGTPSPIPRPFSEPA